MPTVHGVFVGFYNILEILFKLPALQIKQFFKCIIIKLLHPNAKTLFKTVSEILCTLLCIRGSLHSVKLTFSEIFADKFLSICVEGFRYNLYL